MSIDLLSKPACVQCVATERAFKKDGTSYTKTDVTQDAAALETAKNLGYLAAPVVLIRDAANNIIDHWSGFRPEKIAQYVTAAA